MLFDELILQLVSDRFETGSLGYIEQETQRPFPVLGEKTCNMDDHMFDMFVHM